MQKKLNIFVIVAVLVAAGVAAAYWWQSQHIDTPATSQPEQFSAGVIDFALPAGWTTEIMDLSEDVDATALYDADGNRAGAFYCPRLKGIQFESWQFTDTARAITAGEQSYDVVLHHGIASQQEVDEFKAIAQMFYITVDSQQEGTASCMLIAAGTWPVDFVTQQQYFTDIYQGVTINQSS